jgi:hypothetical protein
MTLAVNILCSMVLLLAGAVCAFFAFTFLNHEGQGQLWTQWWGLTAATISAILFVGGLLQFRIGLALDSIVQSLRARAPQQSVPQTRSNTQSRNAVAAQALQTMAD